MNTRFTQYLQELRTTDNGYILDAVLEAYGLIMQPAQYSRIYDIDNGGNETPIKNEINNLQNKDNEYFPQTLSDKALEKVNNSYSGSRLTRLPVPSKTHIHPDGDRHQSAGGKSATGYAGTSGGYNLGGPTSAG